MLSGNNSEAMNVIDSSDSDSDWERLRCVLQEKNDTMRWYYSKWKGLLPLNMPSREEIDVFYTERTDIMLILKFLLDRHKIECIEHRSIESNRMNSSTILTVTSPKTFPKKINICSVNNIPKCKQYKSYGSFVHSYSSPSPYLLQHGMVLNGKWNRIDRIVITMNLMVRLDISTLLLIRYFIFDLNISF